MKNVSISKRKEVIRNYIENLYGNHFALISLSKSFLGIVKLASWGKLPRALADKRVKFVINNNEYSFLNAMPVHYSQEQLEFVEANLTNVEIQGKIKICFF